MFTPKHLLNHSCKSFYGSLVAPWLNKIFSLTLINMYHLSPEASYGYVWVATDVLNVVTKYIESIAGKARNDVTKAIQCFLSLHQVPQNYMAKVYFF